jgi:L-asparaginase II
VYRGNGIEAEHYASVAVVDREGRLIAALGDPEQAFFTRSSIKPLQALPLVMSGAADAFGLTEQELSLCAASHNGSDEHRRVALSILEKCGANASDLACGAHWPAQLRLHGQYPIHGEDQDPLRHNCSGKHAGFIALSKFFGVPVEHYLNPEAKVQTAVRHAVARAAHADEALLTRGIDGCSAPNYALPLVNLARAFKNVMHGFDGDTALSEALTRVSRAMLAHPLMVSGEKRLDYDLARSFPGNVICKVGAEALEAIAFREPALGIVVKVHDGADRALGPICIAVLKQLGIIQKISDFPLLERYERPTIRNYRKLETGYVSAEFSLEQVRQQ